MRENCQTYHRGIAYGKFTCIQVDIVTKVRAMQAKLLTDEDFRNIAAFHTVTEVAAYLKEHPGYRNVLADMDENRLHRGEIEKLLVQSLYSDYTRLLPFFRNGSEKIPGALSEALRDESDQLLSAYCIQPLSEAF